MTRSLASASPAETTAVRLELRNVSRGYGATTVVHDVSCVIQPGEHFMLVGPAGSGKTTLLMLIAGFETLSNGEILFDGRRITREPPHLRDQGFIFHHRPLFPHLSLAQNLAFPLQLRGLRRTEIQSRIARMLERFDLQAAAEVLPSDLSAVHQFRGALARALVFDPALLLMDEPMSAIEPALRRGLCREIQAVQQDSKVTIVHATRDIDEAHAAGGRIATMSEGRIEAITSL